MRAPNGRGYFGIGIAGGKSAVNVGTLWRSAYAFDAAFIFTAGARYPKQSSDTLKTWRHVPMFTFSTVAEMLANRPTDCPLVAVELLPDAVPLAEFTHPDRAIYVLGAEDNGVPKAVTDAAQHRLVLPGRFCLNVAVAGALVMAHRDMQRSKV